MRYKLTPSWAEDAEGESGYTSHAGLSLRERLSWCQHWCFCLYQARLLSVVPKEDDRVVTTAKAGHPHVPSHSGKEEQPGGTCVSTHRKSHSALTRGLPLQHLAK